MYIAIRTDAATAFSLRLFYGAGDFACQRAAPCLLTPLRFSHGYYFIFHAIFAARDAAAALMPLRAPPLIIFAFYFARRYADAYMATLRSCRRYAIAAMMFIAAMLPLLLFALLRYVDFAMLMPRYHTR